MLVQQKLVHIRYWSSETNPGHDLDKPLEILVNKQQDLEDIGARGQTDFGFESTTRRNQRAIAAMSKVKPSTTNFR
jgi:hypothetical protein